MAAQLVPAPALQSFFPARLTPKHFSIGVLAGLAALADVAEGEKVVASGQFLLDSEASLTGIAARPISGDPK